MSISLVSLAESICISPIFFLLLFSSFFWLCVLCLCRKGRQRQARAVGRDGLSFSDAINTRRLSAPLVESLVGLAPCWYTACRSYSPDFLPFWVFALGFYFCPVRDFCHLRYDWLLPVSGILPLTLKETRRTCKIRRIRSHKASHIEAELCSYLLATVSTANSSYNAL